MKIVTKSLIIQLKYIFSNLKICSDKSETMLSISLVSVRTVSMEKPVLKLVRYSKL